MRMTIRVAFLLLMASVVALPGQAQLRQAALSRLASSDLLFNPAVQKDLKLTTEQTARLTKLIPELQAREQVQLALLPPLGRDKNSQEYQDLLKQLQKERHQALMAFLLPEQMKRLQQIEAQQRGLADPQTQRTLKLTTEQKEKITKIDTELQRQLTELLQGRPAKESIDKANKLARESRDRAVAVLSEDQKKTWREMTGEAIDLPATALIPAPVFPFQKIEPKDIRKKDPNIPDIYRTKPKKIDI